MNRIDKLQREISDWQKETFGTTPDHLPSMLWKLQEEMIELGDNPKNEKELADIFILVLGIAAAMGVSGTYMTIMAEEKHKVNVKRTWSEPDENGLCHHIEEEL